MSDVRTADSHDFIRVFGAQEHNLRKVDVEIPKRRLTVFTGVSGSGKSSLVFATIAAESQRMINETYSAFLQGMMPNMSRPDVDRLEGLTTAILVDQERLGANSRSTVGTATDTTPLLRTLFSRIATPALGSSRAYSFNIPTVTGTGSAKVEKGDAAQEIQRTFTQTGGMCAHCEGMGVVNDIDPSRVVDPEKSLNEGAILVPGYKAGGWSVKFMLQTGFFDPDKKVGDYTAAEYDRLLFQEPIKVDMGGAKLTYEGLVPKIRTSMLSKDREAMQKHIRTFVDHAVTFVTCPECEGTRLNEGARTSRVAGKNIAEACAMQITDLAEWVRGIEAPEVAPLVTSLLETLDHFSEIGLGYLSLDRPSGTLSGGEAQRIKMVRHLGSSLTDVTYIFDEPSAGLHPHDIDRLNRLLLRLRDKGNTVLVVEHKPEVIAIADHVVDLGPGAGAAGGTIGYSGPVAGLTDSDTLTGRHLGDRVGIKDIVRAPQGTLEIRGAHAHNLANVDVDVPLGVLTVITGVAGSGKSSLIHESLPAGANVVTIDQSGIKGSSRSNPATYAGILEPIRKAFAKANGVKPALFSANSAGACPHCKGLGVVYTDLGFMATFESPCDVCEGKRFQPAVLEYTLGGKDIHEVLELSATEAHAFFSAKESKVPAAVTVLGRVIDVGLGYIHLGQPLSSLSGGERQRLKLAAQLADKGDVYVLDEPTVGLHLADVQVLLSMLDTLVENGKSVIVVEHHQAVMAHADWIIDLGPGAGHEGGRIVFEGTPAALVAEGRTLTAQHLAKYVGRG